ncbi:MAG: serine/threonine-protein phosphatase [Actinomycetales bacterium]|nr:serine/threonine-protein phosphatase [Actinomycetales bacterium]
MSTDNAAVSDVGKVRASNQDSGYAGTHLLAVADGMGGHAGGDVASHMAIRQLLELDRPYDSPEEARGALLKTLLATNDLLGDIVYDHSELAGLGTTVSAIIRVSDKVAIAHIGDSRIYLLRGGELSQVTIDHTFVQRLIDSGRITEAEAKVHPRRSVLMRVLGDVDANPEIDTMIVGTQPGDRWMLCSDGLTGVVSRDEILSMMIVDAPAHDIATALLNASLAGGAPDNVTVVVADVTEGQPEQVCTLVGSASEDLSISEPSPRADAVRASRQASRSLPVSTSDVPIHKRLPLTESEQARSRRIRRRAMLVGSIIAVIVALIVAGVLGYRYTQSRYFVGADAGTVAIYQGIPQDAGPFTLSHLYLDTGITLDSLPAYRRDQVVATISTESLAEAQALVARLAADVAK